MKCKCPEKRTDGLPPCGKGRGYPRPDGFYCDCGHDVNCCLSYGKEEKDHAGKS